MNTRNILISVIILVIFLSGGGWYYLSTQDSNNNLFTNQENLKIPVLSETTKDWLTFEYQEYGFKLKYPKELIYRDKKGWEPYSGTDSTLILSFHTANSDNAMIHAVDKSFESIKDSYTNKGLSKISESKIVSVNSVPGSMLLISDQYASKKVILYSVKDKIIILEGPYIPTEEYQIEEYQDKVLKEQEIFENMYKSFELIK